MRERLGCLDADKSCAEHDGTPGTPEHVASQGDGVVDGAERPHAGGVEPGNRRPQRRGARREHERVVRQLALTIAGAYRHGLGLGVERDDLAAGAHIERERGAQRRGRLDEQRLFVGDLAADEIRQSAVRERHVLALFEHDDLRGLVEAASARGAAHPPGDAADDHDLPAAPLGVDTRAHGRTLLPRRSLRRLSSGYPRGYSDAKRRHLRPVASDTNRGGRPLVRGHEKAPPEAGLKREAESRIVR